MRERLRPVSLTLHPEKTRLIEFGRFAARNRELRGLGKPETFKFLGFVVICAKFRRGVFQLRRQSRGDRMMAKLPEIKEALRKRMHVPIPEVGTWLAQIVASTLPTMPCRPIVRNCMCSATMSLCSGTGNSAGVDQNQHKVGDGGGGGVVTAITVPIVTPATTAP